MSDAGGHYSVLGYGPLHTARSASPPEPWSEQLRVFVFAEYYPNPFKPYLDTQFAETIGDGHELSIFAFGTWGDAGSRVIADFHLADRTGYLPAAPRHLGRFFWRAAARLVPRGTRAARAVLVGPLSPRDRIVNATQALLLPSLPPDLCLIHDLGTAVRLRAIRAVYPRARIALYYHAGEVAPGVVRDETEARNGLALADVVFVNTVYGRNHAVARGCDPDRIHLIPVGFDLDRFPFDGHERHGGQGPLRLAVVARLGAGKGVEHAIDAIGLLAASGLAVRCTIVGDGDERRALEERVRARELASLVRFVGTLPHHEVIATMSAADILLVPSVPMGNWVEAQGCVLQEAMLVGTMIIASDIGGVAESIPAEMHDCLVPPGDPAAIAAAVHRLARMPVQERQSRARVNRAFCESRYDIRALNRRMLARALVDPGSAPDDTASPITAPHAPRRSR